MFAGATTGQNLVKVVQSSRDSAVLMRFSSEQLCFGVCVCVCG